MKISKKAENIRVTAANAGQRIDNFLMSKIKNVPKSHIHKIIRTGQTRVNGSRVKSLYKIKIDDIIRIPPYTTETKLTSLIKQEYKEQINKNICYEDDNYIIVNKPTGLSVHSGSSQGYGLIDIVRELKKSNERIDLAHRIDRSTSGLIIITKNLNALRSINKSFLNQEISKKYFLVVNGLWNYKAGIKKMKIKRKDKQQEIKTLFKKIKNTKELSFLEAELITGKTHQIRKHCYELGFPIVGDKKYFFSKNKKTIKSNRLLLHAGELKFHDHLSKKNIHIQCKLPGDFYQFMINYCLL